MPCTERFATAQAFANFWCKEPMCDEDKIQIEQFLDWVAGKQVKVVGWKTMTNDQAESLLEMVSNKARIEKAKAAFEKTEGA